MLTIPKIQAGTGLAPRDKLAALGLKLAIATTNWPQYGARVVAGSAFPLPRAEAWLAHSGDALHLLFAVTEDGIRAANSHDQDPVWQDSCVELFLHPGAGEPGGYYNFEFSCVGKCLSAFGPDRHQRTPNPPAALDAIVRQPSLGHEAFGYRPGIASWELQVRIPADSLSQHRISQFDGREMRLNLYKCGDALPEPHYLSWHPIRTEQPDFHRPECFGPVRFAYTE